jgi:hypothetical protein
MPLRTAAGTGCLPARVGFTAALLLERLLELLQLVLLLREQLEPIRLALRRFIEYGGRLCD